MSVDEYHRRTVITRLSVATGDESLLRETVDEWKHGCQLAVDKAWNQCQSPTDVQQLAYDDIREQTELGSQHAILASHQAAENIKSCISRRQNGKKASKPTYTTPTVTYDSRTLTVFPDQEQVSLTTHGDHPRVRADLVCPDSEDGYQYQYLNVDTWEIAQSTLHYRNGEWYLHLGFRKPKLDTDQETPENGTVLGVDLGVNQIAVTSTARFFSAGALNHNRREFERTRSGLQETGSRSSHGLAGSSRRQSHTQRSVWTYFGDSLCRRTVLRLWPCIRQTCTADQTPTSSATPRLATDLESPLTARTRFHRSRAGGPLR